jgi:hypothetical protein
LYHRRDQHRIDTCRCRPRVGGALSSIQDRLSAPRLPIATVSDHNALLAVIRRRVAELDVSYEVINEIAGLQSNYLGKVISNPPPKRMGMYIAFLILQTLGLQFHVSVAPDFEKRMAHRLERRKLSAKKPCGRRRQKRELTPDFLAHRARRGGLARTKRQTPEQISAIGRKGAAARWFKKQCRDRQSQVPASPNHRATV